MRVLLERRWRLIPHALFWTWFTVDGIYVVYWATRDLEALFMRPASFWASFGLYGMCGLVWYPRDTLKNTLLAWKKHRPGQECSMTSARGAEWPWRKRVVN